jgi:hypothetical protein
MSSEEHPQFKHLQDCDKKASLVRLRNAVTPILANNVLPHFTDHSVMHSDNLTRLIDELVTPIQETNRPLSDTELTTLYGTCYLHDIGLQYEKAGDTETIRRVLAQGPPRPGQRWEDLSEASRRDRVA